MGRLPAFIGYFFMVGMVTWQDARAEVLVENRDRVSLNWSTMRLRFYGQARPVAGQDPATAEKAALQDGLSFIVEEIPRLWEERKEFKGKGESLRKQAVQAAHDVAASTYAFHAAWDAAGAVRVDLESNLAKALASPRSVIPSGENLEAPDHSGIVIYLDSKAAPKALFSVYSADGKELYGPAHVSEEGFRRNLMGRWFRLPVGNTLRAFSGKNPLEIKGQIDASGRIRLQEGAAEALRTNRANLNKARVAIVTM